MLHDRLLKKFVPGLLDYGVMPGGYQPQSPDILRKSMSQSVQRGAQPRCLELNYLSEEMEYAADLSAIRWPPGVREAQL